MVRLLSDGLLLLQLFSGLAAAGPHHPRYKDPHAPVEARVEDLLSRMTLEDKAAQLVQGVFPFPFVDICLFLLLI